MPSKISILKPGMYTTLQDKGRFGNRSLGVPTSGFLDTTAATLAQWLAGNDVGGTVIEMIAVGGMFHFEEESQIAIAGADMRPTINGSLLPDYHTVTIPKNATITFGAAVSGNVTYLAVAGKIEAQDFLGSTSTYAPVGWGGHHGRPLQKSDVLSYEIGQRISDRSVPEFFQPKFSNEVKIRILPGAHWCDQNQTLPKWIHQKFTKSPESNRMGLRLISSEKKIPSMKEIISTPTTVGAIQLPPSGNPIVVMADGQTTGGYPHIATIIEVDIPRIAQVPPGGTVSFEFVTMEHALKLLRYQHEMMKAIMKPED